MAAASEDHQLRQRMHRIDDLLKEIDHFKDPQARARTREIVQALMEYHGAALEKLLDTVAAAGEPGLRIIDAMAMNDAVASLLLLYGLHPLVLETRVEQALEKTRPYLRSHGGNVQLLGVAEGVVRLRLDGSCHGCPSSAQTLKQAIQEAIFETAPDVTAIEVVDELVTAPSAASGTNATSARSEPGRFVLPILSAK